MGCEPCPAAGDAACGALCDVASIDVPFIGGVVTDDSGVLEGVMVDTERSDLPIGSTYEKRSAPSSANCRLLQASQRTETTVDRVTTLISKVCIHRAYCAVVHVRGNGDRWP